jgi:NADH-quinone oxidoreductase subunit L
LLPDWFGAFVGSMVAFPTPGEESSVIPLATSLTVSLGGLLLGWLAYRRVKAGAADPLQKALGGVYTLLKNKYYVDEFYNLVFIRPAKWVSETLVVRWVDQGVLDGALHGIARAGLWLGNLLAVGVDRPVVKGAETLVSGGTRGAGLGLSGLQKGRIQGYMLIAIATLVVAGLVFIFWLAKG